MAWWTKSGWKRSWNTRAWRKKSARVASRRADREMSDEEAYEFYADPENMKTTGRVVRRGPRPLP